MLKSILVFLCLIFTSISHADIQERMQSAVIKITTTSSKDAYTSGYLNYKRTGNAVLIDSSGLALTLAELIAQTNTITAHHPEGYSVTAEVLQVNYHNGIAIIKIPHVSLGYLDVGNSDDLSSNDPLLLVSHEKIDTAFFGVKKDILSSLGNLRTDNIFTYPAIAHNYRGAAVLDQKGKLIGILDQVVIDIDTDPKVRIPGNTAISSANLMDSLASMLVNKSSPEIWHGLRLKHPKTGPLVIAEVIPNSPAHKSGFIVGHEIYAINSQSVMEDSPESFHKKLRNLYKHNPDKKITFTLLNKSGMFINKELELVSFRKWLNNVR